MKKIALLVVILAASSAAGIAVASTSSVTITTPKVNSSLAQHHNPYTAVAGTVSFANSAPATSRFYLRRDGCGTTNDNPHLSITSGTDAGDGCGLILDQVGLVGDAAPQATFTDYAASDGMPLALDGTHAINGQVSLSGGQVGLAEVDVTLEALIGGQAVTIGSGSGSALLDPTGTSTPVPFTISPNMALDGSDVQALDLRVTIHGPNVYSGFVALSGASYVDVPSYTASVNKSVSISLDDPTFSSPIPARVSGSTWSVAIPTPAVGKHTIYAESTQGFDTSSPASTTYTVKK
ncbi:MAG TPA: hypothetical protein VFW85_06010 [Gaiellaceae bacterium]|nr:hypothetical protein [Gaiellaceae bacterium]